MINFKNVHHLREVLVIDDQGKVTSAMQYSTQKISRFRPDFAEVPFSDQAMARELYKQAGGHRRDGMRIGLEVILEIDEMNALQM